MKSELLCWIEKKYPAATVNYPKYPVFFKEQNGGFGSQIQRVTEN